VTVAIDNHRVSSCSRFGRRWLGTPAGARVLNSTGRAFTAVPASMKWRLR
jgi:hypothetical protein